ncbi:MAG: hypothetical protein R3D51_17090 [Hyphomicrobiaceae bacterium]
MNEEAQPLDHPPEKMSGTETLLSSDDASGFSVVRLARLIASQTTGIIEGSEQISKDPKYGIVVRYDIVNLVKNDGAFHPEDGKAGEISEVKCKQIFFQKLGEKPKGVTIPLNLDFHY